MVGIQGCDDHLVVAMPLLEFLHVPHVRLTAVQYDIHDALVGIRISVAKCVISQTPLISGEQLREGMGDLRPFAILLIDFAVIPEESWAEGKKSLETHRRNQTDAPPTCRAVNTIDQLFEHKMSFKDYLRNRRTFNTASGHFTGNAQLDPYMPDETSWEDLKRYLEGDPLLRVQIAPAYEVWMAYQKSRQKKSKRDHGRPA